MMSEYTPNTPIEENYNAAETDTAPIPIQEEWPEVNDELPFDDSELLDLDYGDKALVETDPVQHELRAPIDDDAISALMEHDMVVEKRYGAVEALTQMSAKETSELKNEGLALGSDINRAASFAAETNRQQILEAVELYKRYAEEAGRLALAEVERRAAITMDNGESIQEMSVRIYKAATDIVNKMMNDVRFAQDSQQRSIARRDNAIETKNKRISEMEKLWDEIQDLQADMDASQAKISQEYEPVQAEILGKKLQYAKIEQNTLSLLKPTILAILSERYETDKEAEYDAADPDMFMNQMRGVYEELAQTETRNTGNIRPDHIYEAVDRINGGRDEDIIKPNDWFVLQRRRRIIQQQEDDLQLLIDREEANISNAQLNIDERMRGMAQLAEDRDYQHGLYQHENQQVAVQIDMHSAALERIAMWVNNIIHGDATQITEAAIMNAFGYTIDNPEELPEGSMAAQLVDLLHLKRRYLQLVDNAQDAGANLPFMPAFVMPDLPALEVGGESAFEMVTENAENVDKIMEQIAPFKDFADKVSFDGIKAAIKDTAVRVKRSGVVQKGITQVFRSRSNQEEVKEG